MTCPKCGSECRDNGRAMYCSCGFQHHLRVCGACLKPFHGEWAAPYCSDECKYKSAYYSHPPVLKVQEPRPCAMCGKVFIPKNKTGKYHSEECADKADRIRKNKHNAEARAKKAASIPARPVSLILKREVRKFVHGS